MKRALIIKLLSIALIASFAFVAVPQKSDAKTVFKCVCAGPVNCGKYDTKAECDANVGKCSPDPGVCSEETIDSTVETTPTGSSSKLQDPLNAGGDIPALIGRVIKAGLGVVGSIALLMFIYGGFLWMMAGGASDKVKKGRDILIWASIGLAVIFSSYAILNFIFDALA